MNELDFLFQLEDVIYKAMKKALTEFKREEEDALHKRREASGPVGFNCSDDGGRTELLDDEVGREIPGSEG